MSLSKNLLVGVIIVLCFILYMKSQPSTEIDDFTGDVIQTILQFSYESQRCLANVVEERDLEPYQVISDLERAKTFIDNLSCVAVRDWSFLKGYLKLNRELPQPFHPLCLNGDNCNSLNCMEEMSSAIYEAKNHYIENGSLNDEDIQKLKLVLENIRCIRESLNQAKNIEFQKDRELMFNISTSRPSNLKVLKDFIEENTPEESSK